MKPFSSRVIAKSRPHLVYFLHGDVIISLQGKNIFDRTNSAAAAIKGSPPEWQQQDPAQSANAGIKKD